jgi:hypothetical protein
MNVSTSKTKVMGICGINIQRVNTEIYGKVIEEVSDFIYLENIISELMND